ncbi:MAG: hypothetical protein H6722_29690 [Sandaracinus sp.]|nr:hypothetical protein [Sandaracinus sp.]
MTSVEQAYERFRALGAVLGLARYPLDAFARHEVPVQAMRDFARRHVDRLRRLNPGRDVSAFFHITLDPDVSAGRRVLDPVPIASKELFGPGYDVDTDELRLFTYGARSRATLTHEGLAYALLNPPYGLRDPDHPRGTHGFDPSEQARMRRLLRAFCADVLCLEDPRHAEHLTILRWPTDWSTYFDAGKEWWGCFCWTIEDRRHDWVTAVAASTTD